MLSETRRPLIGRVAPGALAVGAALALTACGPLPLLPPAFTDAGETVSPEPVDTGTPTEPVETEPVEPVETEPAEPVGPEDTDVFSFFVGDCVNEITAEGEFSEAPKIDCSEPHDQEVYHSEDLRESGAYPGLDQVSAMADDVCHAAFEGFVGTAPEGSGLGFTPWFPTEEGWTGYDDREVLCLVFDPAGQTTGTLAGSAL
ncbi:septum formation family protein [Nocardiopsis quinghaiensis]|uniref:septum formation family protein n=1 Tax=Nocardiopsis quinghaiensis TaxID=464995 RepID=UPI0012388118|nr:septum formation family protein [Nocardiopsis quinghaiensis]